MAYTENTIYLLLLGRGVLFVTPCRRGQEFSAAAAAEAGILGVFSSPQEAVDEARKRARPGIRVSTPPSVAPTQERKQS